MANFMKFKKMAKYTQETDSLKFSNQSVKNNFGRNVYSVKKNKSISMLTLSLKSELKDNYFPYPASPFLFPP